MRKFVGLLCLVACLCSHPDAFAQHIPNPKTPNPDGRISPFVRRIFEDSGGNLWLGTNGDGVVRYNGRFLEYFGRAEGFGGAAVRGIVEDQDGNVWFGTSDGVIKYDGVSFASYTEQEGLINNDVWCLAIDSKGAIWIGTLQGVSVFDGESFAAFALPETEPDYNRGVTSARIVHSIMEDRQGKMWFGTNGGAYSYDGKSLSNISEKDGLCHNAVNCILEAKDGSFWFATHYQGVCRWDGESFTHVAPQTDVSPVTNGDGGEAWDVYQGASGDIWFPVEGHGVYRYDGTSLVNFSKAEGLASQAIQCTYEDREGRVWFGGWMGLFRFDGKDFVNVTVDGPWR